MATPFKYSIFSIAGQKERLANVVGVVNAAFNPFSKSTVEANVTNPTMKTALETFANHPYISAGIIAGGYTAITAPAKALIVAKSVVPTTLKGKVIAAVAAPVVLGAFAREPVTFTKAVIEAPSELAQFGGDISSLLIDPSLESLKQLVKESPWLVGGVAAATLLLATKGLTPAMILLAMRGKGNGKETVIPPPTTPPPVAPPPIVPVAPPTPPPTVPVTPPTETVTAKGLITRRRRRLKKAIAPRISQSQRVNVLVSSRSAVTQKHIKREVLAY